MSLGSRIYCPDCDEEPRDGCRSQPSVAHEAGGWREIVKLRVCLFHGMADQGGGVITRLEETLALVPELPDTDRSPPAAEWEGRLHAPYQPLYCMSVHTCTYPSIILQYCM